jgi:hypothetical protein
MKKEMLRVLNAANALVLWRNRDVEFVIAAAEYAMENGISQANYEQSLFDELDEATRAAALASQRAA